MQKLATQIRHNDFSSASILPLGTLLVVDERTLRVKGVASNAQHFFPGAELMGCPLGKLIGTAGSRAIRKLDAIETIGVQLDPVVLESGKTCECVVYPASTGCLTIEIVPVQKRVDLDATAGLKELVKTQSLEDLYRNFVSVLKERFRFEHSILYRLDELHCMEALAESLTDGVGRGLAPLSKGRTLAQEAQDILQDRPVGLLAPQDCESNRICMSMDEETPFNCSSLRTLFPAFGEYFQDGAKRAGVVSGISLGGKLWGVVVLLSEGERTLGHVDRVGLSSLTELFPILYRNIVEQKRSEELVDNFAADGVSPFAKAFRLSTCGMTLCSLNGQILNANPSICEILGLGNERILGESFLRFVHPDEQFAYARYCRKLLNGEKCKSDYTVRLVALDGSVVRVQLNMAVSRDPDGEPQYFVTQYTNLTELLEAKERQSKIQNDLMRLQRLESLATFAGGIAHDFNNMLASLYGYLELMEIEMEQESCVDLLRRALQACHSGQEMVESLLSFTRQKTWQVSEASLSAVCKEVHDVTARRCPAGVEVKLLTPPEDMILRCDPTQVSQMLQNLVYNACEAAYEFMRVGAEVELSLESLELTEARELSSDEDEVSFFSNYFLAPGRYAVLQVSDNGPGITEDILEHIFEPFFSTKDPGKGTGLGLSVVFGIVERHSGTISVISKPGKGTRFRIILPSSSGWAERTSSEAKE